jgi:hypothetical protein
VCVCVGGLYVESLAAGAPSHPPLPPLALPPPSSGAGTPPAPWLSLKMFFLRSMMRSAPSAVSSPMSPVWKKPSESERGRGEGVGGGVLRWGGIWVYVYVN